MTEWDKVGEGWAGYGVSILVLLILSLIALVMGQIVQRFKSKDGDTAQKKDRQ